MFCLNYYPSQKYLQDADELKIRYRPADRTLKDFLEVYQNRTIIIDVTDSFEEVDAQLLKGLYDKYKNIKIIFDFYNKEFLARAQQIEIPFFFTNLITTIDQLHGLLKYNPTDMYICEELGFSLDKISKILHDNNVRVRVFPNICQSSFPETPSIKTFFIRPEDIPFYQKYVDVFQLIIDQDRQRVLHKIYNNHKWLGPIDEIIPSFKDYLDNRYVLNNFGQIRSRCGKRCMLDPSSCDVCGRFQDLTNTFEAFHLMYRN